MLQWTTLNILGWVDLWSTFLEVKFLGWGHVCLHFSHFLMFYYTWKSNTYTWLKKQNKTPSIMKVYIVKSKSPPTAWLPGPLWRGSHCLCVYFWRLHAYTSLYVWLCICHLSLFKGNILHTPFCTLLFHLKYFRMYCLTIGIDQFHSFYNTETI